MNRRVPEGDGNINPSPPTPPRNRTNIHIYTNEYIINSINSNSAHNSNNSNFRSSSNHSNIRNLRQSLDFTPQQNRKRKFGLNNHLSELNNRYKNSFKNSILNSKELDLLQKKIRILKAEEHKVENKNYRSQELKRKKDKTKRENEKQKTLVKDVKKLKEKEIAKNKIKVKDLRNEEFSTIIKIKEHKKNNSENLANKQRELKKRILEDLSREKNRINEEKRRKTDILRKIDDDIMRRKKENEKRKKKIIIEQLELENKLVEEYNRKLLSKIKKLQKIGLKKIDRLLNIQ